MNSATISMLVLACTLVGMVAGSALRGALPQHHLRDDSRDVIKTASGMIATLVALILGLLVASAKDTFDTTSTGMNLASARVIQLDRTLVRYGPETHPAREMLRQTVQTRIEQLWPTAGGGARANPVSLEDAGAVERFQDTVRSLTPNSEDQRQLQAQALQLAQEMEQARWQIFMQSQGYLPKVFLGILIFWLLVLYTIFGLLAPRNATAFVALLVCAMSVAAAVFLILEMYRPMTGFLQISDIPMRKAFEIISRP